MRPGKLLIVVLGLCLAAPALGQDGSTNWALRWNALGQDQKAVAAKSILASVKEEVATMPLALPINQAMKRAYDRCFLAEKIDEARIVLALDNAYAQASQRCYGPRSIAVGAIQDICQRYEQEEGKPFGDVAPPPSRPPCV